MKGSIDKVTSEGSIGWLFAEPHGRKPLVQAFLHHRLVGQAVADLYRPDLEQVGLGDGRHGFEIRFDEAVDPTYLPFLSVRPEGFDLTIPANDGPRLLDLVRLTMQDYPVTGRTRSVLGGLWTDRLDAASVLAGRMAVASIPVETQPVLSNLIAHGFSALRGATEPHPLGARELDALTTIDATRRGDRRPDETTRSALAALAGFLFRDSLIRVLRAAFDDHPVAYRIDVLTEGHAGFLQASIIEALPSPGECAVLYLCDGEGARVEIVRDSHELAEFTETGRSRWSPGGTSTVFDVVTSQRRSLDVVELEREGMMLVGPGTIHRLVNAGNCTVMRVLLAPRRVTPTRFLSGDTSWIEGGHSSGARLRL